jgi:hypothetical protein
METDEINALAVQTKTLFDTQGEKPSAFFVLPFKRTRKSEILEAHFASECRL